MSKYILGSLATLLAVKGKDALPMFTPPGLSTDKERNDAPPSRPTPAAAPATSPDVATAAGYGGKPAPVQPPHPEIN